MVIFLLGLSYCIINPVMCVTTMLYLSFVLIFERFNNIYVYKLKYDSGGAVWGVLFHEMMVAVYFMQVRRRTGYGTNRDGRRHQSSSDPAV